MKLTTFLASIIALTTLTPSCTSLPANCGDDRIHKGDDRYCEIPRIATNFYREHVFYNVYTYPEIFFYWLPKESKRDTINVLALGDSWFAYPKSNWLYLDIFTPPANALTHLAKLEHPSSYILSLSNAGELVTNIAGLARQDALELSQSVQQKYSIPWATVRALRRMKDKTVTSNSFDYILISGGGNDFFASRIRSVLGKPPCATPQEALSCINEKELNQIIDRLREAYVTLITTIRSEPGYEQARIVTHTYDKIYPMPIGAKMFYGLVEVGEYGWFYPVLEEFGITDKDQQRAITNRFLGKFQDMLLGLQKDAQYKTNFMVVDTQGVMDTAYQEARKRSNKATLDDFWLNEIHPSSDGFRCISETIHNAIRADMRERKISFEDKEPEYKCIK